MSTLMLSSVCEAPSGPQRHTHREVAAEDPARIAAFVLELDALFDARAYATSLARSLARDIAQERGLDPLWTEVLALELARNDDGDSALRTLNSLWGDPEAKSHPQPGPGALAALFPADDAREALETLRPRFKLAVVSARGAGEARK